MSRAVGNPRVGQWYLGLDSGELFQVTGFDQESDTIELQTFDGDLNEIELDTWRLLPLALAQPPQDWSGPADDANTDDFRFSAGKTSEEGWTAPLRF